MKKHQLKIDPAYFEALIRGEKPFEFRKNDRNFCEGDTVDLLECSVKDDGYRCSEHYTGRSCTVIITRVYDLGAVEHKFNGYVVFTFHVLKYAF